MRPYPQHGDDMSDAAVVTGTVRTLRRSNVKGRALPAEEANHADLGLVLMDLSLKTIALDRGAAAILNLPDNPRAEQGPAFLMPPEVERVIRDARPGDLSAVKMRVHIGTREYKCRVFLVKSQHDSIPHEVVALHLERDGGGGDSVAELSAAYNLTTREQEALRGIAMGLSNKEIAERMNINPGTVKSFLRLIMIKARVKTRGAIFAKLLEYNCSK